MSRTDADVEGFFNDLDTDETDLLIDLIADLDPLAQEDGKPKYTGDQITLIGRFQQFVTDHPDDEDFDDEDDEDDDDDSGDIAGTGETEEEYVARVQREQAEATAKAAETDTAETQPVDSPVNYDRTPE